MHCKTQKIVDITYQWSPSSHEFGRERKDKRTRAIGGGRASYKSCGGVSDDDDAARSDYDAGAEPALSRLWLWALEIYFQRPHIFSHVVATAPTP